MLKAVEDDVASRLIAKRNGQLKAYICDNLKIPIILKIPYLHHTSE